MMTLMIKHRTTRCVVGRFYFCILVLTYVIQENLGSPMNVAMCAKEVASVMVIHCQVSNRERLGTKM